MASNLVPDYEVKVLLKPGEVLRSNNELKDTVLAVFNMPPSKKKMNVQFVDTTNQELYSNGWILRIRKTEGEDEFELTYKKRFDIGEEAASATEDSIAAACEAAKREGFDSSTPFTSQVEVGYQKQTLSISHDESVPDAGFKGTDLPLAEFSRKLLIDRAPEEFKNSLTKNWGTSQLASAVIYGPVLAKRSKGYCDKYKVFIEVWPVRKSKIDASIEPIVEASLKTSNLSAAMDGRAKLVGLLQNGDRDWLLAEDFPKTKIIMERYGETTPDS